jgi:hypothetical protein
MSSLLGFNQSTERRLALAVNPNSQFKTLQDFIAGTKNELGKYTYTSVGVGTAMHLVVLVGTSSTSGYATRPHCSLTSRVKSGCRSSRREA